MEGGADVNTDPEANVEEGSVGKAKGERGEDDREGGEEAKVAEGEKGEDDREGGEEVKVAEGEKGGDHNASPEDWQTPPSSPPLRKEEEEEENMEVDRTDQNVHESGNDSSSDEGQRWGWQEVSEQEREFP